MHKPAIHAAFPLFAPVVIVTSFPHPQLYIWVYKLTIFNYLATPDP